MEKLLELRDKLDVIDEQIVALYEERMRVCEEVAKYKIEHGKKVLDRAREEEKLKTVQSKTTNEFNRETIYELYELIMAQSRELQKKIMKESGIIE